MTQQTAFTIVKNAWNNHAWTESETEIWQSYCRRNPIRNKRGEGCLMFPYIAFQKVNITRVMNSLPVIYTPPAGE